MSDHDQHLPPSVRLSAKPDFCFPPPPHDPRERQRVATLGEWGAYVFDPRGEMHAYFARKGMVHLQLYHPRGVSILTPSVLTQGRFELLDIHSGRYRAGCFHGMQRVARHHVGIVLPGEDLLAGLHRWHVARHLPFLEAGPMQN